MVTFHMLTLETHGYQAINNNIPCKMCVEMFCENISSSFLSPESEIFVFKLSVSMLFSINCLLYVHHTRNITNLHTEIERKTFLDSCRFCTFRGKCFFYLLICDEKSTRWTNMKWPKKKKNKKEKECAREKETEEQMAICFALIGGRKDTHS